MWNSREAREELPSLGSSDTFVLWSLVRDPKHSPIGEHGWGSNAFYCRDGTTLKKRSTLPQTTVTVLVLALSSEETLGEGE